MHFTRSFARIVACAILAIVLDACATGATSEDDRRVVSEPEATLVPRSRQIGRSLDDRPIGAHEIGDGEETVLMIATIHGDESAGTPLLWRLLEELPRHPTWLGEKRLVVVPVVNPDGYALKKRTNRNGVDLNRNFPAENFDAKNSHGPSPLSEPESKALAALIEELRPSRVISFHEPLACIDWDGPGEAIAATIADAANLPKKRLGSRPGSLGSWVGETLGIPIITFELPRHSSRQKPDDLWKRYGPALLAALR